MEEGAGGGTQCFYTQDPLCISVHLAVSSHFRPRAKTLPRSGPPALDRLSVSVLDLVPATLPSFLGLPRSLSSNNPAWVRGCLPLAVSSGAYPHPGMFWGRRVTDKDQQSVTSTENLQTGCCAADLEVKW